MWKGWKDIVNITALMTFFIRGTSHSPYALRRLSIWFDWNWLKNCWELSLGSIKLIFMHFQTDRDESEVSIIMIFSSIWMLLFEGGQGPENYWVTSIKWEICQLQKDGHKSKINSDSTNNLRWMYFATIQIHVSQFSQLWGPFFHINHIHKAYFPTALVVNIDFMLNWHIVVAYKWEWCNY